MEAENLQGKTAQRSSISIMGCYKRCYLKEWARDTADIHGLKHIAGDGGNIRRGIWTLATLGALGYFLYLSILTLISFIEANHVTKVDLEYKSEISFPAFTVCNFNKYRESAITEHDIKNVGTHLGECFYVCFYSLSYLNDQAKFVYRPVGIVQAPPN